MLSPTKAFTADPAEANHNHSLRARLELKFAWLFDATASRGTGAATGKLFWFSPLLLSCLSHPQKPQERDLGELGEPDPSQLLTF